MVHEKQLKMQHVAQAVCASWWLLDLTPQASSFSCDRRSHRRLCLPFNHLTFLPLCTPSLRVFVKKKKEKACYSGISFFFVQNFVWKNYPLLLVESTSNFTWTFFWHNFSSRVIYFCHFFFASKIFVKLLFIWTGLDVFPFKLMKKEACHRVQHVKISRNWSLGFVGCLCACLKNQTIGRQWKMSSTALNACNRGYRGQRQRMSHRCHGKHGEHRKKLYKWYGDRVEKGESCKPTEPATGEMIFPGPPNGVRAIFAPLPQKMPILFHSGNKRQFKLCSQSVSNYQNQLVEAEKLFKKSHIFAWFHCISGLRFCIISSCHKSAVYRSALPDRYTIVYNTQKLHFLKFRHASTP